MSCSTETCLHPDSQDVYLEHNDQTVDRAPFYRPIDLRSVRHVEERKLGVCIEH